MADGRRPQAADLVALARSTCLSCAAALRTCVLSRFDVIDQLLDAGANGEVLSVYTDCGEDPPPAGRSSISAPTRSR